MLLLFTLSGESRRVDEVGRGVFGARDLVLLGLDGERTRLS